MKDRSEIVPPTPWAPPPPHEYEFDRLFENEMQRRMVEAMERIAVALEFFMAREHGRG